MEYHGMFGTGLIFFLFLMLASLWKCERVVFAIDLNILTFTKIRRLYIRLLQLHKEFSMRALNYDATKRTPNSVHSRQEQG